MSPMSGSHTYSFDEEEQLWLSAGTDRLLVLKHKSKRATLAVARKGF